MEFNIEKITTIKWGYNGQVFDSKREAEQYAAQLEEQRLAAAIIAEFAVDPITPEMATQTMLLIKNKLETGNLTHDSAFFLVKNGRLAQQWLDSHPQVPQAPREPNPS